MVNRKILSYVKKYKKKGYSSAEVEDYLLSEGYASEDINEALKYVKKRAKLPHYKFFLATAIFLIILGIPIALTQNMHLIRLDLVLTTAILLILISVILKSKHKL